MNFIILFILGTALLLVETLLPSYLILGVIGLILIAISWFKTISALPYGIFVIFLEILLVSFIIKIIIRELKHKISLKEFSKPAKLQDFYEYIGKVGITKTNLRPVGKALFDNAQIEVISVNTYIEKGTPVKCVKIKDSKLYVDKLN